MRPATLFSTRLAMSFLLLLLVPLPGRAQEAPPTLSAEDYARAESQLGENMNPLVFNAAIEPEWLPDARFWYRNETPGGSEYVVVDPAAGTRRPAFDHERMANALSAVAGASATAAGLPRGQFVMEAAAVLFAPDGQDFRGEGRAFRCRTIDYRCEELEGDPAQRRANYTAVYFGFAAMSRNSAGVVSPDGAREAFIRDHDLWVREMATGGGDAAHLRWRGGLRLRDQQCGLGPEPQAGSALVSGQPQDRHLPARRARRGDDVPGEHPGGSSRAGCLALSPAGGLGDLPHPPGGAGTWTRLPNRAWCA